MPWFSSAGAKGTVTMMIGSKKLQIFVACAANLLEGVTVVGRML
jgi:hypothetical protein